MSRDRFEQDYWTLPFAFIVWTFLSVWSNVPATHAAVRAWDGGISGFGLDWFDAENWSPDGLPAPSDQLTIDVGSPEAIDPVTTDLGGSIIVNNFDGFTAANFDTLTIGSVGAATVAINGADLFANDVSVSGAASSLTLIDTFGSFVDVLSTSNSASVVIGEPDVDFPVVVINHADLSVGSSMTVHTGETTLFNLTIQDPGSSYVGTGGSTNVTNLILSNGSEVDLSGTHRLNVAGNITIGPGSPVTVTTSGTAQYTSGSISLDAGQLNTPGGLALTSTLSGNGTVSGNVAGDKFATITASGAMILGDPTSYLGFNYDGTLAVGVHTVILQAAGYANVGILTQLSGGTIQAANGIALGVGDNISGSGQILAKVAGSRGSTIEATGDLAIGDATTLDGFVTDGVLLVGQHTMSLLDANDAVLGSLTVLGTPHSVGTLSADHGLTVGFGGNVTGHGIVSTPNDPASPLINNGHIAGMTPEQPIVLSGYVKGIGTLDNVEITGTDAPGQSPAAVTRGSIAYDGTLEIEISGRSPGSDYDQVNHILGAGVADLGGRLDIKVDAELYTDPSEPGVNDVFRLITAKQVVGSFLDVVYDDTSLNSEFVSDNVLRDHVEGGLFRILEYKETSVVLTNYRALAGDANGDFVVDDSDFEIWQANTFQSDTDWVRGDFNRDGRTDVSDFNLWNDNKFTRVDRSVATPESSTIWSLVQALMALWGFSSRRSPSQAGT